MKSSWMSASATALCVLTMAGPGVSHVSAQSTGPPPSDARAQTGPTVPAGSAPIYKPPLRGAPGGRVGGGTRGGDQTFTLSVLAPNHTALTLQEQPTLYWFVSKPITTPVVFTLSDDGDKPLVEQTLAPPFERGIHRLSLADFGAMLRVGKQYRWFVSLVGDPKRRSRDVLAGATIERAAEPDRAEPGPADAGEQARLYAAAGQWYDAIAALSRLIERHPAEANYRSQRAALLQQIGLAEIAEFDLGERGP